MFDRSYVSSPGFKAGEMIMATFGTIVMCTGGQGALKHKCRNKERMTHSLYPLGNNKVHCTVCLQFLIHLVSITNNLTLNQSVQFQSADLQWHHVSLALLWFGMPSILIGLEDSHYYDVKGFLVKNCNIQIIS